MPNQAASAPIAIVGVGSIFPGSADAGGFWRDLLAGRDLMTDVPATHWLIDDYYDPDPSAPDKTYCKRGAFLSPTPFDPVAYGIPPSTLNATDTAQLLALIVAKQVLEDAARGQFAAMDKSRISVILGATSGQELFLQVSSRLQRPVWVKALREHGLPEAEVQAVCDAIAGHYVPWQESTFPGLLGNVVAGRIANRFDLGGTNCVTDAACASSFAAVAMAIDELQQGRSDMVISGGVDTFNDIGMYMCFSKTPALSPTGDCRPFSDQADGTMMGEGLAMVALKRLADAERDGDRIYAVIRGLGASSDGRAMSVYAPLSAGQARALDRAYEAAGYGPESVELVEAHGTGTKAGDAAEFEGLKLAFTRGGQAAEPWCALGSVKSQIGHTKAAAGAAGLMKAVLALHHKVLPPTIKVERPNPKLGIEESPFYLNTAARPWVRGAAHPRRASVSAFGFGGSNFHVALEEYTGAGDRPARLVSMPTQLVVLAGADGKALAARCRELAGEANRPGMLAFLAQDSQRSYKPAAARLAVVATDEADLAKKLLEAAGRLERAPDQAFSGPSGLHYGVGAPDGDVAFLFPGQGSQYVGMGTDLALAFPAAQAVWDRAADVLPGLAARVFPRPVFDEAARKAQAKELTATQWAQPAIGAASLALLGLLRPLGLQPVAVAGHSFGELSALACAGAYDAATLLQLARRRGELMAEAAARPGAMLAVSAPREQVEELLAGWNTGATVANHNGPRQVVLAGSVEAIDDVERRLGEAGLTCRRLPVATAFHSEIVAPAGVPFRAALDGVGVPMLPVFGNTQAAAYPADAEAVRDVLAGQIARPVRFVEMIEAMYAAGCRTFLEVGPGAVLSGLVTDILGDRPHRVVPFDRNGQHGVTMLWEGLGRLAAAGCTLDFAPLWEGLAAAVDPRTQPTPAFTVPLLGSNYGRPYPPVGGTPSLPAPNPARPVQAATPAPVAGISAPVAPIPAPVAMSHVPAAAPVAPGGEAMAAFQALQQTLADSHQRFQATLAQSQQAYMASMEQTFLGLWAGQPAPAGQLPAPAALPAPAVLPVPAPMAIQAPAVAPPPPPAPAKAPSLDIEAIMLAVVAEKTGYPPEMLQLDMALEADLGIDSIKRVEILAAVQAKVPGLPEVDAARMGAMRTLAEIVDYMRSAAPAAPASTPAVDVEAIMLAVVAEKTGYPPEMLQLEMALEADLGIDSIKRVEILAAVQAKVPGLPEVDAARMGAMRTLAEIVDYMRAAAPAPTPSVDVEAVMLAVVAEKTGYPPEMLQLDMALEADLGIDSIKRVEILAAVQAKVPGLPEVDAARMGAMRTLAEIVDFMRSSTPAPKPSVDVEAVMLSVVAEKTGYPPEMLQLDMALEADLGIDSIKRVEILAAVQAKVPGLPEVDAGRMASMRTLAEIVGYMREGGQPAQLTARVPAAAPKLAEAAREAVRALAVPATGHRMALEAGPIVILPDDAGVAEALAGQLTALGLDARVTNQVPQEAVSVVYLGGLRTFATRAEAVAVNREAFQAARALAGRAAVFVTVQDTGGDFGLAGQAGDRAWAGGLPGLAKTVAREWERVEAKAIDLERGDRPAEALAQALLAELRAGGPEREVGLKADGTRLTLAAIPAAPAPGALPLDEKAVVLVSGGARGVTAATMVGLARAARCRFVLLGRTPLATEPAAYAAAQDEVALKRLVLADAQAKGQAPTPAELGATVAALLATREVNATLAAIRAAGAQARYLAADVQDEAALAAALAPIRAEWGAITAVVHGAGVLADKLVAEKTDAQFDRVFDTKVRGLEALLAVTKADPLTCIALFSSVAAREGNPGQADYAMANSVLDQVALAEAARRGPGCRVKTVGWGPWAGGMVTPALQAHFARQGVALLEIDAGVRAFEAELASPADVAVVVGGSLSGATGPARATHRVTFDGEAWAFLGDHRVQGRVVVPAVIALELFLRAARSLAPGRHVVAVRDLTVLKGILLEGFPASSPTFMVEAEAAADGIKLTLTGADGTRHYAAHAELGDALRAAPRPAALAGLPAPMAAAHLYDEHLFHGPAFQVLEAIEGPVAGAFAAATRGAEAAGWGAGPWQSDPAALDGAIQLALVWGIEALGRHSLPTRIGTFVPFVPGAFAAPARIEARCAPAGSHQVKAQITLLAADGTPLAALEDLELTLLAERQPVVPRA